MTFWEMSNFIQFLFSFYKVSDLTKTFIADSFNKHQMFGFTKFTEFFAVFDYRLR